MSTDTRQDDRGDVEGMDDRWEEIRRRMEEAGKALERGFEPSPEEKIDILRARAEKLARETRTAEESDAPLEVVEFLLSDERYAVELTHIREVCQLKDYTALPSAPAFVLGIINVRGKILSLVDLKKFFDLSAQGIGDLSRVIILESDEMEFGIIADEILGMSSIPVKTLQTSLPTLTGIRADYLKGITGDRTVILDGEKLLSDEAMVVHQEVES